MAGITSQVYRSIHHYWRHRAYQRLEPSSRQVRVVRLGVGSSRSSSNRQLTWKVRVVRPIVRLRSKLCSPFRLLTRMRDAYVDAMLALAGGQGRPAAALQLSKSKSGSDDGLWGRRIPKARQVTARRGDFEKRMMVHIYNSLITAPELPGV
ncbi:uncharacterized protein [Typha angustifolia]|uniref:uncharacterized protein n=1 Tax=Typha angustifolia TaxID=59011 RepID=UPI003C2BE9E0